MSVGLRVRAFREQLAAQSVQLVLVSKHQSTEKIADAYEHGQRDFGESRVQELVNKAQCLPRDIRWHMIGHLQTNKVKYIAPFIHLVHSVDSVKLLETLNKEAKKVHRLLRCLVQVRIAANESKYGFSVAETKDFFSKKMYEKYTYVSIAGLMGMASHTQRMDIVAKEYELLHELFSALKAHYHTNDLVRHELSMGMSGDYKVAMQHGSTMLRIGKLLFSQSCCERPQ